MALALTPEEALRKADRLESEGALRDARTIYEEFLASNRTHVQAPDVRYKLALCIDKMGDIDGAIKELSAVLAEAKGKHFRHRADAFMHLAKLYKTLHDRPRMIAVLKQLIDEGAGLYEADAYDMCASALAVEGKTDEAAAMFTLLKRKRDSAHAKSAAYKLAVLWLKSGKIDLASQAVEEFVVEYGTDERSPELMMAVARDFFEHRMYAKTKSICEQVKTRYARSRAADEASYLVALCYKEAGRPDTAITALTRLVAAQKAKNPMLAGEAAYMIGRIREKDLKEMDSAVDAYRLAVQLLPGNDARSREILTYCYLQIAEHLFAKEEWSGALDMYLRFQQVDVEVNVTPRIMTCKAKLGEEADMKISLDTDAEREFLLRRIKDNPGTLMAAELETMLLDKRLSTIRSPRWGGRGNPWKDHLQPLSEEYAAILKKYPVDVLKQADLVTHVYMQMGHCRLAAIPEKESGAGQEQFRALRTRAIDLFEQALAANPDTLNTVGILETIAYVAECIDDKTKAFDAYRRLYDATGIEDLEKRKTDEELRKTSRDPLLYLAQMVQLAHTDAYVRETINRIKAVIGWDPKSDEARRAQFQLAELYFMARKYSTAVQEFKTYVRRFGPAQDENGDIVGAKEPEGTAQQVREWYDAGVRMAHCWFVQGNDNEMLKAYRWVAQNQPDSPHGAEAWYYAADSMPEKRDADKETKAELLWRNVVNRSMDFGSQQYRAQYRPWVRPSRNGLSIEPRCADFVSAANLKSAQLYMDLEKYELASEILKEYLKCTTGIQGRQTAPLADASSAKYALGRCLIHMEAFQEMANIFRPYIDDLRDDRFRASALLLLGHYGRDGGLHDDAAEALAALLDEYGRTNKRDEEGKPIPIPEEERLRKSSKWRGICMKPPEDWDAGKVRFSLGHLYWQQEDWDRTVKTLETFFDDARMAKSPSRNEALFMLGRSYARLKNYGAATRTLWKLVERYPEFKGTEEAYVDLVKACYSLRDFTQLDRAHGTFARHHAQSQWRPYVDLYKALAMVEKEERLHTGMARLKDLATAETFEDVKADAYYHIGMIHMRGKSRKDYRAAMGQLERSINLYPTEKALLAGAQCALNLKDAEKARGYLERTVRDFQDGDSETLREADKLLREVIALKR